MLVKWRDKPEEEATWEDYWPLIRRFPTLELGTRSILEGERNCNNQSLITWTNEWMRKRLRTENQRGGASRQSSPETGLGSSEKLPEDAMEVSESLIVENHT